MKTSRKEWVGSYLITSQKVSGSIRGISPVDIWRRVTGNDIVQVTQQMDTKTCIDTYTNFKQLVLSKDGASHCLYFLNETYSDPPFTSAEDETDPMMIVKLDIANVFGSLCARLEGVLWFYPLFPQYGIFRSTFHVVRGRDGSHGDS